MKNLRDFDLGLLDFLRLVWKFSNFLETQKHILFKDVFYKVLVYFISNVS